jgi:RNA recognition motif-containing protein
MKIYVGNLSWQYSEDQLLSTFATHGEVTSATIITDRETGRSKGFGFVEMPSKEQAEAAISALNNAVLDGRNITVNEARPRPQRPNNGGGGGARGGFNNGGGRRRY